MKKLLFFMLLMGSMAAFSQGTVTGTVTDDELGGPLPGATVMEVGTNNGAVTDFDGNFTLSVSNNSGRIQISYIGFEMRTVAFTLSNGAADLGNLNLVTDANTLAEVVIIGSGVVDLAEDRETPIAVSTIRAEEIQAKVVGNVELTEAVRATPSAYVSGDNGFGDSQLYLRGFDNTNIAILLNGQPVNSPEDGRLFWSNWAGLADVASAIQVQRGLGSSKLAISSVGGTMNIVMKAADKKEGGFVRFLGANDSYFKGTASYNTGINDKGWAFSMMVDYWQAHRKWARGTYGEGQNYFFSLGYTPNDKHSFNFLVTGAPQLHGQRFSQSRDRIAADPKFNEHWGFYEGEFYSERQNYYHKPVMNLNWDWNISEVTELSTVLYASWGRGGGTGPRGGSPIRTEDPDGENGPLIGQIDFDATQASNLEIPGLIGDNAAREGYIRRSSVNNHQWYGAVSNLNWELSERFSFNVGADVRLYTGDHFRQVTDFFGLQGWANDRNDGGIVTEAFDANPWAALTNFASEDQRIDYDYSEDINYLGGFGQLEYTDGRFSVFVQGALSTQSYQREGRFEGEGLGTSDKISKPGLNLKGGFGYEITENQKLFFNGGYYERQPFLDNIFVNIRESDQLIVPEIDNEVIRSVEGGYHIKFNQFWANFNAYVTDWDNRTLVSSGRDDNGTPNDETDDFDTNVLQRGIRQFHTGAELDFNWRTTPWLTLNGYLSGGSWTFKGQSSVAAFNAENGQLISEADGIDRDGVKVSVAPQFTTGMGAKAKIAQGLSIDGSIDYRARHYEFTDEFTTASEVTNARLKPYSITDLGVTYNFSLGSNKMTFRANVFNVFDYIGIQASDRFGFFNENGRTFNASLRYAF